MNANNDIGNTLLLAREYAAWFNLSLSTVSVRAAGAGALFPRLASGQVTDMTLRRRDRIAQWFSDNWPADLEWPREVPRPAPTQEAS